MAQYSIVVLDTDENRTDYFKSVFLRDDHDINIFPNINEIITFARENPPTAFLVEYTTMTAENRADIIKFFKENIANNVFIYNVPDNANKRLAFYELGAKRVFDTSQPLEEIYFALIWPLKNIKSETNRNLTISSGKLEDIPLKNLVSTLAREERTGILKVITQNNSGKIYLRDGFIWHAKVGLFSGEEALLHILFWQSGNFSFHANASFDEIVTVHISLVSVLLIAEQLRQKYVKDLLSVGSMEAIVQIRYAGDLAASAIKIEDTFIENISRPVVLKQILENSVYTCYETAEKLSELKKSGFLSVTEPAKKDKEKQVAEIKLPEPPADTSTLFTMGEARRFDENIGLTGEGEQGNILIISTRGQGSFYFMRHLVEATDDIMKEQDISALQVEFLSDTKYTFWGLSMSEAIFDKIEKLPKNIVGLIFLIDVEEQEMYEYSGYVIRRLTDLYNIPWIPVLFNTTDELVRFEIRNKFNIPKHIPIYLCDVRNAVEVKDMLLNLKIYEQPKEKKSEQKTEKENN